MTKPHTKSLRRRIVSTLVWTLALLLLTNVGWSVWAFFDIDPAEGAEWKVPFWENSIQVLSEKVELGIKNRPSRTRSRITLWTYESDDSFFADAEDDPDFEDVCPRWARRYIKHRGTFDDAALEQSLHFESVGWPLRVLWAGTEKDVAGTRQLLPATGVRLGEYGLYDLGIDRVLPIRPILGGQAFYFVFWLAVVCAVPFTRRRFRHWRGRCTNCNYDLRGNTTGVCSECGAETGRSP